MSNPSRYLTIRKAAALLHVTPMTLRRWDREDKFKAKRHPISRYRLYPIDQIKRLLAKIK